MKTFKEWFDGLSERTQAVIIDNCDWVDMNEPDYRKKAHPIKEVDVLLKKLMWNYSSESNFFRSVSLSALREFTLEFIRTVGDKGLLPVSTVDKIVKDYTETDCSGRWVDIKDSILREKAFDEQYRGSWSRMYNFWAYLATVKDFDNITWENCDLSRHNLTVERMEILGKEKAKEVLKENPALMCNPNELPLDCEIFDELWFGEDGWTNTQKHAIMRKYSPNMEHFKDFIQRIVAVDHGYLRWMQYFIEQSSAFATDIYSERKPEEEITSTTGVQGKFRFNKDIRQLAHVCACCERKRVGKAMQANLGISGSLLKLYGFNFNEIYNALFPEDTEILWR